MSQSGGNSIKFAGTLALTGGTDPADFSLLGGEYAVMFQATNWGTTGTADLQVLGPDGTNYISCGAASKTTNASSLGNVDLAPGDYRIHVTAPAAGVSASVVRIPR